jgi:hypothetical protein
MAKQNITLSLDKDVIRKAKLLSARKFTSVSRLLSDELERVVREHDRYEQAKRSALAALKKGLHLGGKSMAKRDELHDRQGLR